MGNYHRFMDIVNLLVDHINQISGREVICFDEYLGSVELVYDNVIFMTIKLSEVDNLVHITNHQQYLEMTDHGVSWTSGHEKPKIVHVDGMLEHVIKYMIPRYSGIRIMYEDDDDGVRNMWVTVHHTTSDIISLLVTVGSTLYGDAPAMNGEKFYLYRVPDIVASDVLSIASKMKQCT